MKPADIPFGFAAGEFEPSAGRRHFAARLSGLLRSIGLDVAYERAAGDWLTYHERDGRPVRVLDLVGGYGVLLLGHNHPALVAEAQRLLADGMPIHVQGSLRPAAERLARQLSRRAGDDYRVVLANTGAEAVEAAMKHAMLQRSSRRFVALEGGYHGKTLGAIQLTANASHRGPFTLDGIDVVRVRPNDTAQLEAAFERAGPLAGFVFEPIQGEGGVRPLELRFVQRAAELCAEHGVPLIADECQTGVGRTGRFLACQWLGVRPDYVLLSKALGGGLANISALLVRRSSYVDAFDLKHTSTFAADGYSCAIAARALELIDESALARCRDLGDRLLARLRQVQARYPDVIRDVRGRGLMLGVELRALTDSASYILRYLSGQQDLAMLLAGYLLNVHAVRIAATLSDPFTLRLAPSIQLDDEGVDRLIAALHDVCDRLRRADAAGLTAFLAQRPRTADDESIVLRDDFKPLAYGPAPPPEHPEHPEHPELSHRSLSRRRAEPARVAWLCHLIDADDLVSLDPALASMAYGDRDTWLDRLAPLASPVLMNDVLVRSRRGQTVRLHPIMLPVTSRWMKCWIDARRFKDLTRLVAKGVDMARGLGCGVVALGQYTSIATLNGTLLRNAGIGVTTGNSYAIGLALEAIERAQQDRGVSPAGATLAIIGAAGNIGRACAQILAPRYRQVVLIGARSADSLARLSRLAGAIPNAHVSSEPADAAGADVVLAATNAVNAPLLAHHLAGGAIVCDLSVPAAVDRQVRQSRPDLMVIKGGIARLPYGEDLGIVGFPLPAGHTYGCMAESMLLGFDGAMDSTFIGSLQADHVRRMLATADRHGFELADYKTTCVLSGERQELAHAGA